MRATALLAMRTDTAADLQRDIERYLDIDRRGLEALSRFDRMMCEDRPRLGVAEALSLKHNHISYNRGRPNHASTRDCRSSIKSEAAAVAA